ncbi:predicted protein [Thalassiosira pseudonana CCMP1335]|uniref:Uncharacterized protein n=1 Tax=Thalassiosira pseudonana TaxID=35128 RepID=B8BWM3_THAPS|nr:predicted protein [Thalassiosira pseudonana CCMP1335]EED94541.1 predicted protein [Thalassiosira pseudonana CCMP1335]
MSSLAATQADGYYIPSEYIDSGAYKKQSVSQFAGSKGHNQYLQRSVVRFELPFDGFCTKCEAIVGKGTRFNAHKAHADDYFTSKIYEFTTKCRACADCTFKIRTNPKEQTFDYVEGIRKKVEEFDSAEAGTHGVIDTDIGAGIYQYKNGKVAVSSLDTTEENECDILHLMEKHATGRRKAITQHEQMESLMQLNSKMGEDADANAAVRASFRKDRKAKRQRMADAASIGLGKGIELSSTTGEDTARAKHAMDIQRRHRESGRALQSEKGKFQSVRSGSIFSSSQAKSSRRKWDRRQELPNIGQSEFKVAAATTTTITTTTAKSNMRRKIVICPQSTKNETRMQTQKSPSPAPTSSALSALADYGSDSD